MPAALTIGFDDGGPLDSTIRVADGVVTQSTLAPDTTAYISNTSSSTVSNGFNTSGNVRSVSDGTFFSWDAAADRVGFSKKAGYTGGLAYGNSQPFNIYQFTATSDINPVNSTPVVRAYWDTSGKFFQSGAMEVSGLTRFISTVTMDGNATISGQLTLGGLAGAVVGSSNFTSQAYGAAAQIASVAPWAQVAAAGTQGVVARSDHVHATAAMPVTSLGLGATTANLTLSGSTGAVSVSMAPNPSFTGTTITGILKVLKPSDSSLYFQVDPTAGQVTFPSGSISGAGLVDGTVGLPKLSNAANAAIQAGALSFFNGAEFIVNGGFEVAEVTAGVNSTTKPYNWTGSGGQTWVNTTTAFSGQYVLQLTTSGSSQQYWSSAQRVAVTPGQQLIFRANLRQTQGPLQNPLLRFQFGDTSTTPYNYDQVHHKWVDAIDSNATPIVTALNTWAPYFAVVTVPAGMYWLSQDIFVGVTPTPGGAQITIQLDDLSARRLIQSDDVAGVSVTKLIAGTIASDDINIGTAGRLYAGASKTAFPRLEFAGGGTDASRGIFGYLSGGVQSIALTADGKFSLRSSGSSTGVSRINVDATSGLQIYSGTATTPVFNADLSGNLSLVGALTATSGLFLGDVQIATATNPVTGVSGTGALLMGSATHSGQRLSLHPSGIKGFLSSSTGDASNQSLNIATDGSMWLGSPSTFAVSAAGALTATSATLQGSMRSSTIVATSFQTQDFAPPLMLDANGLSGKQYFSGVSVNAALGGLSTDTTMTVFVPNGTALPPLPHLFDVNGEWIQAIARPDSTHWTVQRGILGTTISTHAVGDNVYDLQGIPTLTIGAGGTDFSGSITGGSIALGSNSSGNYTTAFNASTLADFSDFYVAGAWSMGQPSGYAAQLTLGTGGTAVANSLVMKYPNPAAGTGPGNTVINSEVYAQFGISSTTSTDPIYPVMARATGSTVSDATFYAIEFRMAGTPGVTLIRMNNGVRTALATGLIAGTPGTSYYKARLRVIGQQISAKVWLSSGGEPTAWKSVATDGSITAAGMSGMGALYTSANNVISWFALIVNGLSGAFNVDPTGALFMGASTLALAQTKGFSVTPDGTCYAVKFNLGGGATHGTNYVTPVMTATQSIATSPTGWPTIGWGGKASAVEDNGTMFTAGNVTIVCPVYGMYSMSAIVTFSSNTAGRRGVRWVTTGGTICTYTVHSAADTQTVLSTGNRVQAAQQGLYVQVYNDSGSAVSVQINSTGVPSQATLTLIS